MLSRRRRAAFILLSMVVPVTFILLIIEGTLRLVWGAPVGTFAYLAQGRQGLYLENATIDMLWGTIPYTVKTNSLGLRGRDVARQKSAGTVRLAAIGDSITDGFFVDNNDTFPAQLEGVLQRDNARTEVINVACGGGSIDRELALLREVALPLQPDIVLLTFVTNDISDIRGKSLQDLVSYNLRGSLGPTRMGTWFATRTAVGEVLTDTWLRLTHRDYGTARRSLGRASRYEIPGGRDFEQNVELFYRKNHRTDTPMLTEPLSAEATQLVSNYLFALARVNALCRDRGVRLYFVYFPSYPEIYAAHPPTVLNQMLRDACRTQGIPFIDSTPLFREAAHGPVLHLAPLDFHLNPRGNRVMAEAVASFLLAEDPDLSRPRTLRR